MDNQEKMATLGTQDTEDEEKKNNNKKKPTQETKKMNHTDLINKLNVYPCAPEG